MEELSTAVPLVATSRLVKCIQAVCVNVNLNAETSSLLGTLGKLSSTF